MSGYDAYVRPIQERPNLHILTSALVTKILFENGTAVGVEFEKDEELYKIQATKEVVLSAGTINSPQILMLSGIGPVDHLRQTGITIVRDSPVGLVGLLPNESTWEQACNTQTASCHWRVLLHSYKSTTHLRISSVLRLECRVLSLFLYNSSRKRLE